MLALREGEEAEEVQMHHFTEALNVVRPSVDDSTKQYYNRVAQELEGGLAQQQGDYTRNIEVG